MTVLFFSGLCNAGNDAMTVSSVLKSIFDRFFSEKKCARAICMAMNISQKYNRM
jgi:hypothetical protein